MSISQTPSLFLLCLFSLASSLIADEAKPDKQPAKKPPAEAAGKRPAKKAEAKPKPQPGEKSEKDDEEGKVAESEKLHRVEKDEISVTQKVSGLLVSRKSTPMALDLKQWSDLLVVEALPHGTEVSKGDVIVELATNKIEEEIENLEAAMPLKELELKMAQISLEKLEKSTPISLEKARESKMRAEEDFAYFEDVSRPMREKDAAQDVKRIEEYLAYAEEELNQLKKMYEADDLTEETEEIILRRAQNTVNDYLWMLEQTRERSDRMVSTLIPREQESLERGLLESQLNWRTSEKSLPDALEKAELEFLSKQRALEKAELKLDEFRSDLEAMTVRAPHDGIVYYGMTQRGKWTTASTVERKLIPGGKLTMREIFMTVVDPSKVHLLLSVPEAKLADLDAGQTAAVELTSQPDAEIEGKVRSLSHVPYSDNTFAGEVQFTEVDRNAVLFPGMKAEAEITVYEKEDAILIPKSAVKEEEETKVVTLNGGEEREVETGREADGKIEIVKGLKVGEEIVLSNKPAEKESEKDPGDSDSKKEEK